MEVIAYLQPGVNVVPFLIAVLYFSMLMAIITVFFLFFRGVRRRAKQMGYANCRSYLRAIPKNDVEKQDAVSMAAKGMAICVLGVIFPPIIILGLIPLYYGVRKCGIIIIGHNQRKRQRFFYRHSKKHDQGFND